MAYKNRPYVALVAIISLAAAFLLGRFTAKNRPATSSYSQPAPVQLNLEKSDRNPCNSPDALPIDERIGVWVAQYNLAMAPIISKFEQARRTHDKGSCSRLRVLGDYLAVQMKDDVLEEDAELKTLTLTNEEALRDGAEVCYAQSVDMASRHLTTFRESAIEIYELLQAAYYCSGPPELEILYAERERDIVYWCKEYPSTVAEVADASVALETTFQQYASLIADVYEVDRNFGDLGGDRPRLPHLPKGTRPRSSGFATDTDLSLTVLELTTVLPTLSRYWYNAIPDVVEGLRVTSHLSAGISAINQLLPKLNAIEEECRAFLELLENANSVSARPHPAIAHDFFDVMELLRSNTCINTTVASSNPKYSGAGVGDLAQELPSFIGACS